MAMIEAKKLRKVFGPIEAVRGVSFTVNKGEALGFLGPNGAGKSTVMRMLTCFLTPTSGTAIVGGHDILTDSMEARRVVGYLPENSPLYGDMSVNSFLRFIGEMRGYRGADLESRVDAVAEKCWLKDVRQQRLDTLSKGYMRRVGLAQALIHDPPILILDEPTDGLDPNQKHEVRLLIQQMTADKSIIVSTHILEEVEAICTRAIIVAKGAIVADDTPANLKKRSKIHNAVRLAIQSGKDEVTKDVFKALADVQEVKAEEKTDGLSRFLIYPKKDKSITRDIVRLVRDRGWELSELHVEEGDLNEVFRSITIKEGAHT